MIFIIIISIIIIIIIIIFIIIIIIDRLVGLVVSSGTGSTQPCEDNWVATWLRSSGSD